MIRVRDILNPPPGVKPVIPSGVRKIADWKRITEEERIAIRRLISREYNRKRYRNRPEATRAYQRAYYRSHLSKEKNKLKPDEALLPTERETIQYVFTAGDILHATTEKSDWMIGCILSGARGFVV